MKYFSDKIGVMYYGKMVELADSDELFAPAVACNYNQSRAGKYNSGHQKRVGKHAHKLPCVFGSDELFANPLHPYTKSLLSAIPLPDPNFEKGRKRIVYNPIAEHDYSEDR